MENMTTTELKDLFDAMSSAAKGFPLGTPEWNEAAVTAHIIGQELVRRGAI